MKRLLLILALATQLTEAPPFDTILDVKKSDDSGITRQVVAQPSEDSVLTWNFVTKQYGHTALSTLTPAPLQEVAGKGWATATAYESGDVVSHGGFLFLCVLDHTSSAISEPGTGGDWTDFWDPNAIPFLLDPELAAIAGLVSAANTVPSFTGAGTAALLGISEGGNGAADGGKLPLFDVDGHLKGRAVSALDTALSLGSEMTTGHVRIMDGADYIEFNFMNRIEGSSGGNTFRLDFPANNQIITAPSTTGTLAYLTSNFPAGQITSGTFADARIAASNVTQHQAALSITESQISDLGAYAETADLAAYALLAGRAGGQALVGGTGTTDDLVLQTTSGVGTAGSDFIVRGGNNGATEFLRILNSGNVGIGTAAPGSGVAGTVLEISGTIARVHNTTTDSGAGGTYRMRNTTDNTSVQFGLVGLSAGMTFLTNGASDGTGLAERMRILANGNVGIGTTVPDGKLEINAGTTGFLRISHNDADGSAATRLDVTPTSTGAITYDAAGSSPAHVFADPVLFSPDNTHAIGANGATRPSIIYVGTSAVVESQLINSTGFRAEASDRFYWSGRAGMSSPQDGIILFRDSSTTDFNRLQLGGTTAAEPAIKKSAAILQARLADDSAFTAVEMSALMLAEQSADPADPAEGKTTVWQSDGTGFGDDGDLIVKITAGGVTKTVTLIDFSAATDEEP